MVNIKKAPDHQSKRQIRLRKLRAVKYTNIMKKKKDNTADYEKVDEDDYTTWPAKIKHQKQIVPKTQVVLEAEFDKDLWTSKLRLIITV